MIKVEFKAIGPGTCMCCQSEKDNVLNVTFYDKTTKDALLLVPAPLSCRTFSTT